tara:strand:- start:8658 stop:9170 length:513 start_codon:yes stop_codon:yes gene_type:complete
MVMDYLKKRVDISASEALEELPDWVSEKNASLAAWRCVEQMKREKELYIRRHRTPTDFLVKKTYQIKGSEVASALSMNRATLMNTSRYSPRFRDYLDSVNAELEEAKNAKLKSSGNPTAVGVKKSRKDDLVDLVQKLRRENEELRAMAAAPLDEIYENLPLPIKKKLGIN